jgi:hypothetical protein
MRSLKETVRAQVPTESPPFTMPIFNLRGETILIANTITTVCGFVSYENLPG